MTCRATAGGFGVIYYSSQPMRTLRYAVRQLAATPGFTAVAILIVAIGIGASTAMFSTVHAVVLKPLALPEPDRLVAVYETNLERDVPFFSVSVPNYVDFKARATSFAVDGRGDVAGDEPDRARRAAADPGADGHGQFPRHARRADGPGARLHRRRGPPERPEGRDPVGRVLAPALRRPARRRRPDAAARRGRLRHRRRDGGRPAAARRHRDRGADAGRRRPRRTA